MKAAQGGARPERLHMANEVFLPEVSALVRAGHKVRFHVRGDSMRPFIESDRDAAILSLAADYGKGDVVLAEVAPGHFVLHRIDSIRHADGTAVQGHTAEPDAVVTLRGDGNPRGTERCRLEHLHATVKSWVRRGHEVSTSSAEWRCYSWWWTRLLPVRRYLLAAYRLLWLRELPRRWRRCHS